MSTDSMEAPFFPIIYVRGYAGNDDEIEDTVSDPYMGFNLGSTKVRQLNTGAVVRHFFESPLVRLMKDYDYRDVYSAGLDMPMEQNPSPRSIIIYRYYDQVSNSFGTGKQARMEVFAAGLGELILRLQERVCCGDPQASRDFRVYLVGHSMGGLVIRSFLQNTRIRSEQARKLVDKVFTYATPHNGIDLDVIGNVPAFFTTNSADNFNRKRMCEYLGLPPTSGPVRTLNGKFDVDRFFCLVGTNAKDYTVARGWSSRVVGPISDGLVRMGNAVVTGTGSGEKGERLGPRAFVHRSHSGYYGIVNSEEGYQNLTRFLFGDVRLDGTLEIESISLPPDIEQLKSEGRSIQAAYNFECVSRVRGATWDLSRRLVSENSSVLRRFEEIFPLPNRSRKTALRSAPDLFTAFLSKRARSDPDRPSLGFSIDIGVLVPEYEVDGALWLRNHYPGGYLFRDKLNLEVVPPDDDHPDWRAAFGWDSLTPNRAPQLLDGQRVGDELTFRVLVQQVSQPGISAALVVRARPWNVGADAPPPVAPVN